MTKFPESAAVFPYLPACLLRASGSDAATFLQGQFTNDLSRLEPGRSVYGLWLDRKGRVVADSHVVCAQDGAGFWIVSISSPAPVVARRLGDYIVADDVVIEDATAAWRGLSLIGEGTGSWLSGGPRAGGWFRGRPGLGGDRGGGLGGGGFAIRGRGRLGRPKGGAGRRRAHADRLGHPVGARRHRASGPPERGRSRGAGHLVFKGMLPGAGGVGPPQVHGACPPDAGPRQGKRDDSPGAGGPLARRSQGEIGRASCRERV